MRTQLRAALEESLIDGPDPAEVLAGIHTGIARRQRRNRYYRTGFAISAIVLVLIVSVAAASAVPKRDDQIPAAIPVGVWTTTIRTNWLPPGTRAQEFRATAFGEGISYWSPTSSMEIKIDNVGRNQLPDQPGWQQIEINGRPGREYTDSAMTWLYIELPSGRWAEVRLSRSRPDVTNAQPEFRNDALRIAGSLDETGDLRLRTKFAPSYLPPDQRIIGVETNIFTTDGFGTLVCAAGSVQSKREGPGVRISMTNVAVNKDLDATARIADIQGRPAYRSISGGTVFVADFHGGTLTIDATAEGLLYPSGRAYQSDAGPVLTELIKIAQGVRWTG